MKQEPIILDAKNKALGRLASEAAILLRGKGAPQFERNKVPGIRLVIKNAGSIRVTGRKMEQEGHERYSGYPGGLRKVSYAETFKKDPRELVLKAISGMIPRNRLKKDILKQLTIYVADEK